MYSTCPHLFLQFNHMPVASLVLQVFPSPNGIGPTKNSHLVQSTNASVQPSGDSNSKKALYIKSCGNRESSADGFLGMQSSGILSWALSTLR